MAATCPCCGGALLPPEQRAPLHMRPLWKRDPHLPHSIPGICEWCSDDFSHWFQRRWESGRDNDDAPYGWEVAENDEDRNLFLGERLRVMSKRLMQGRSIQRCGAQLVNGLHTCRAWVAEEIDGVGLCLRHAKHLRLGKTFPVSVSASSAEWEQRVRKLLEMEAQ